MVQNSGNVGIGTTSPGRLLSVSDDGTYSAYFSGRVGIGTNAPAAPLEINKADTRVYSATDNTSFNVGLQLNNSAASATGQSEFIWFRPPAGSGISSYYGVVQNAAGNGDFVWNGYTGSAYAEYMRINSLGNVGIGETAPGSKLSVSGGGTFGASYDTTAAPTNGLLVEGNVGIGTTSPAMLFSVQGNALIAGTTTVQGLRATSTIQLGTEVFKSLLGSGLLNTGGVLTPDCATITGSASLCDGDDATGGGSSNYDAFTHPTNFAVLNSATTTPLMLMNTTASSTVKFGLDALGALGIGSTATTTILGNNATSTFAGGILSTGAGGLASTNGLTISGGNILHTGANFVVQNSGNVGIGTTSPAMLLSVAGNSYFDSNIINFASSTASSLTVNYLKSATTTIPLNTQYAFSFATSTTAVPLLAFSTQTNTRPTTTINSGLTIDGGAFEYDSSSGVASVDSLSTGPMAFDADAGILSWVDMPSSTTTANIVNSYSAMMDSTQVLTIYGTTTTSGNISY